MRRRDLLAGGVATLLAPAAARGRAGARDAALHRLLDAIAAGHDRTDARRRLAEFGAYGLSPSARADRDTVTWGLAFDEKLAVHHPPPGATTSGEASFLRQFERAFGAPMPAAALHARFTTELASVAARADRLLRRQGLTGGTLGDRFRRFARQDRWLYPDTPAGRVEAVADMNRTLARAIPSLGTMIAHLPTTATRIRALTDAEIAAGRSGFRSADVYAVDLRAIRARPRWSLPSVVHHEALPGHLAHAAFQSAAGPHPLRLAYAPSFGEGWAIYAETLAERAGLLAGDEPATIGYLQWLIFRLCRSLVDTGVHTRGWSVADARRFVEDRQGDPAVFAPFERDIDRIVRSPGERAAEAMTWLALADLRARHAPARGPRQAEFHYRILRDGPLPMAILRARIRQAETTMPTTPKGG